MTRTRRSESRESPDESPTGPFSRRQVMVTGGRRRLQVGPRPMEWRRSSRARGGRGRGGQTGRVSGTTALSEGPVPRRPARRRQFGRDGRPLGLLFGLGGSHWRTASLGVDARAGIDFLMADGAAGPGRGRIGRCVIIGRIHRVRLPGETARGESAMRRPEADRAGGSSGSRRPAEGRPSRRRARPVRRPGRGRPRRRSRRRPGWAWRCGRIAARRRFEAEPARAWEGPGESAIVGRRVVAGDDAVAEGGAAGQKRLGLDDLLARRRPGVVEAADLAVIAAVVEQGAEVDATRVGVTREIAAGAGCGADQVASDIDDGAALIEVVGRDAVGGVLGKDGVLDDNLPCDSWAKPPPWFVAELLVIVSFRRVEWPPIGSAGVYDPRATAKDLIGPSRVIGKGVIGQGRVGDVQSEFQGTSR